MKILYNINSKVLLVVVATMCIVTSVAQQQTAAMEDVNDILSTTMELEHEYQIVEMIKDKRVDYTLGASVVTITAEELMRGGYHPNLASALVGRVPGMIMSQTNAEPGSESFSSNIRGYGRGPLFIVDGVVLTSLNSIDVNDVESVTIMKDALGGVMYGLQSAGGVVYVTTKRGSNREPSITVSTNYSMQEALNRPRRLGSKEHVTLTTQAWKNDGMPEKNPYTPEQIAGYQSGANLDMYPNNNWYDMFSNKYVSTFNAHVGASGGGEYVKYYASVGYMNQNSPFIAENALEPYGTNRFSIRTNIEAKLNSFIKAYVNVASRISENTYTGAKGGNKGVVESMFDLPSTNHGPLTPEGHVIVTPEKTNPTYGRLNKSGFVQSINTQLLANVGLEFDLNAILPGLKTMGRFKYEMSNTANHIGNTDYTRYTRDLNQLDKLIFYKYGDTEDQILTRGKHSSVSLSRELDWELSYDRVFGDHLVSAMGFIKQTYMNQRELEHLLPKYRMGYGGQVTYGYKNIAFADYAFSYQGSEQFIPANRYSFVNAGSLAILLSNLDFLKNNEVVTYLKLKGSYGIIGSDNFGGERFLHDDVLIQNGPNIVSGLGPSITINKLGNPNLSWEKFAIANVGFEVELWNQLTLSAEYFQNYASDILVNDNLTPSISGVPKDIMPQMNYGRQFNQGVDISLSYHRTFGRDFNVGVNSHFMYYKKEILESGELPKIGYNYEYRSKGYRGGQNWGYQIDYSNGNGYFNSEQDIIDRDLTYTGKQPRLGDFIYVDQNGDDIIDDQDMIPMGETKTPQINWGVELLLEYKGFDLTALFQGVAKYGDFNSGIGYYENVNSGVFFDQHLTAWTPERYENSDVITGPALSMNGSSSQRSNDYYYQDKSFWRVKNLELGYTISESVTKKIGIENLRVYANVVNPFTVDHLENKNHDIEGAQINGFLTQRYWNIGLNVTF